MPNEPFRRRFLELQEREGLSANQLALALGWAYPTNKGGHRYLKGEDRRVLRVLGLKPRTCRRNGRFYDQCTKRMKYRNAVVLCRALGMDPVDAGI